MPITVATPIAKRFRTSSRQPSAPIKWHGGKSYLAKRIIAMMPEHTHYVEPFFGGGAVLLRKPAELVEGHSEVINDIYGDLINFWKVLQSEELFESFQRQVTMTPFSQSAFDEAMKSDNADPVVRAHAFFVRYRQSRQGTGHGFATLSRTRVRRGMNEQVSAWLSAVEGLPAAHERLRRVVIMNSPAINLLRSEDGPQTLFYCDPPYVAGTRSLPDIYQFEMSDEEHETLLQRLGGLQGKFLLSGYPHPMYESAANEFGWNRVDFSIDNKASSHKTKEKKTECIWFNFDLPFDV